MLLVGPVTSFCHVCSGMPFVSWEEESGMKFTPGFYHFIGLKLSVDV